MPVFEWVYPGSGSAIKYGKATILTDGAVNTYERSGITTVVPPSGTNAYLTRLNSRYLYDPSGWNA